MDKFPDNRFVLQSSEFYGEPMKFTEPGDRDMQTLIIGVGIGFALACIGIALGTWVF
jgi:hypothetical protein